jgi:hypothetical protein
MLGIVLFLTALITPFILSVGRSIDFVPRDPPPDGLRTFGLLHATYTVLDGIELILGILVTLWLAKEKDEVSDFSTTRRPSISESAESIGRGRVPPPA